MDMAIKDKVLEIFRKFLLHLSFGHLDIGLT